MKNTTKASISRVKAEVVCPDDHNKGCSTTQADIFKSNNQVQFHLPQNHWLEFHSHA